MIIFSGDDGAAVLDAGGLEHRLPGPSGDPVWDPAANRAIAVTGSTNNGIVLLRRRADRWTVRSRRIRDGRDSSALLSPDGRLLAYTKWGTAQPHLEVTDRSGHVRSFPMRTAKGRWWQPVSWLSPTILIVELVRTGELLAWNLRRDGVWRFLAASRVARAVGVGVDGTGWSWSAKRRYFAAPVTIRGRNVVVIGSSSGRIVRVLPTPGSYSIPVWSPTRPELAWIAGDARVPGTSRLVRYGMTSGTRTVIASGVPNSWWPAWSPHGDWLLVSGDDETSNGRPTWLFVSRDGRSIITYPGLGGWPRWATPTADIHMPMC
jgi:hypothetical protein